jgi:hypothetical protein
MKPRALVAGVFWLTAIAPAVAQTHDRHSGAHHSPATPYVGLEQRAIKALSDGQIADLRAGRGMGLALAAELNGYPGPLHVLELAEALGLSGEQRRVAQALFDTMKVETIGLGERVIQAEAALDRLFADRTVTPGSLYAATARVATAQGELRAAHLRYHLAMRDALTPEQVRRYNQKRGYVR